MSAHQPVAALPASDRSSYSTEGRGHRKDVSAPSVSQDTRRAYGSDADLIQACLDGNQSAWNQLVEHYGPLVYSIPFRWGLSTADAEDVFQNVFTIVYRRLGNVRNYTCLSAWLITVASRECWRLAKLTQPHGSLDETIPDAGVLPAEQVQRWQLEHAVHEAIRRLDSRSQELLKALFFDTNRVSYEEIAARLGLAVGSIGSARARCLKKLEAILIDMGIDFAQ